MIANRAENTRTATAKAGKGVQVGGGMVGAGGSRGGVVDRMRTAHRVLPSPLPMLHLLQLLTPLDIIESN